MAPPTMTTSRATISPPQATRQQVLARQCQRRRQHRQLVGRRIGDGAEPRARVPHARQHAVGQVAECGDDEHDERSLVATLQQQHDEHRYQQEPEGGNRIREMPHRVHGSAAPGGP
jgi:hypothetical protein